MCRLLQLIIQNKIQKNNVYWLKKFKQQFSAFDMQNALYFTSSSPSHYGQ